MPNRPTTSDTTPTLLSSVATRRGFLCNAAVGAITGGALAACSKAPSADARQPAGAVRAAGTVADSDHSGGSTAPHPAAISARAKSDNELPGWPQPAPWKCDTLNVAPGERWDVIVHCTNPGTWAFHCHILPHAETDRGMFGMVTALIVG